MFSRDLLRPFVQPYLSSDLLITKLGHQFLVNFRYLFITEYFEKNISLR